MDKLSLTTKMPYRRAHTNILHILCTLFVLLISLFILMTSVSVHADVLTGVTDLTFSSQSRYSCAVINDDTAKCWGANWAGQVGDGTTTNRLYPVDVSDLQDIQLLTTGGHHTCALLSDKSLKCWGSNNRGQLGDGTSVTMRPVPTAVLGLGNNVEAVAAGTLHTCAIVNTGGKTVKCWGMNTSGQLGNNTFTNSKVPVDTLALGADAVAIAAGNEHTCVVLSDGTVKCWGGNGYGQLGNNDTVNKAFPVIALGLSNVENIITGETHTCALLVDKTFACWGHNNRGQLGVNDTNDRLVPTPVTTLGNQIDLIATGSNHVCVTLLGENILKCWGENTLGQLGNGSTVDALLPANIALTEKITKISLGYNHSCALTEENKMYCWGGNGGGQLGDGTTTYRTLPIRVQSTKPDIALKEGVNGLNHNGTVDLGAVNLGSSVSKAFTIENTGIDALHLTIPLTTTDAAFTITTQPEASVAGGTYTTFIVQFAPTTAGSVSGSIAIDSNDTDENPYSFVMTGTGTSTTPECTPPQAPTHTFATAISTTIIELTWQDESNNETGFNIYRDGALLGTVAADIETYRDSDLSENTTYYYEIKSLYDTCSSLGSTVTVTTGYSGGNEDEESDNETTNNRSYNFITHYLPKELSIFVDLGGTGNGSVLSQPKGIDCQNRDETCRHFFKTATAVELIPTAETGSIFVGWGGHTDCADGKILLSGNRLCTAYFRKVETQTAVVTGATPVYRLWSYYWKKHFYTASAFEKQRVLEHPENWRNEDIAFYAFSQSDHPANTLPVYRFWSHYWSSHFYTINEQEKEFLIQHVEDEWQYEGIAYYAYPPDQQPADAIPVHRLFSIILQEHFYTANEEEKTLIEQRCSAANWRYEGIGWYVVK